MEITGLRIKVNVPGLGMRECMWQQGVFSIPAVKTQKEVEQICMVMEVFSKMHQEQGEGAAPQAGNSPPDEPAPAAPATPAIEGSGKEEPKPKDEQPNLGGKGKQRKKAPPRRGARRGATPQGDLPLDPPNQDPDTKDDASGQQSKSVDEPEPAPETQAGNSPAELPEPGDPAEETQESSGELPELLVKASSLRPILAFIQDELGVEGTDAIVETCKNMKDQIPYLGRMRNIPDRVKRTLKVMEETSE